MSEKLLSEKDLAFKKNWFQAHQYLDIPDSTEQIIKQLSALENDNFFFNEMVVVNCTVDFKPLYVSKNIEHFLGYSSEEFVNMESKAYFNISALDQPDFWENLMKWENEARRLVPSNEKYLKGRAFYAGVSQIHKNGTTKRFLVRHETLFGENFEVPKFTILYFEDVTHFFKGVDYWMLFQNFTDKGTYTKFYRKCGVDNNMLTAREIEILKLIAVGKSSKEIGAQLFISSQTVDQHRKNMIKKTYARDTSALIHFCKTCQVI